MPGTPQRPAAHHDGGRDAAGKEEAMSANHHRHLSHPKPPIIISKIMPPTTIPKTVFEQIKQDVEFSRSQSRPGGPEVAVMTSIAVLEQLIARVELLEWIKANVENIDFHVIVPEKILCANPWIAIGDNFEEAVQKARFQLAEAVKP